MCLTVKKSPVQAVRATKNITAYKVVYRVTSDGTGITRYQCAKYRKGVLKRVSHFGYMLFGQTQRFTHQQACCVGSIDEGLHSYTSLRVAKTHAAPSMQVVLKCIIPRGTLYIRGMYSEAVSLALKPIQAISGPANEVKAFNSP